MREPFEYNLGCSGPSVNIDIVPSGFTRCDPVVYQDPTLDLFNPQFSVPDLNPPPLCAGFTITGTFEIAQPPIPLPELDVVFSLDKEDPCDAALTFDFDLKIPCIGFSIAEPEITVSQKDLMDPIFTILVGKENCTVSSVFNLEIPCIGFSTSITSATINTGELDFNITTNGCVLEFELDITIPGAGSAGSGTGGIAHDVVVDVRFNGGNIEQQKRLMNVFALGPSQAYTIVVTGTECPSL